MVETVSPKSTIRPRTANRRTIQEQSGLNISATIRRIDLVTYRNAAPDSGNSTSNREPTIPGS